MKAAVLLGALAALASLAPILTAACAPGGVCFRLSDCATGSVCSEGACVAAASDAGNTVTDQDAEVSSSLGDDVVVTGEGADATEDSDVSDDGPSDAAVGAVDSGGSND